MPLGRESRQSRNSGNVVQRHSMPASMAAGGMSSARWRLRTTRCLFSSAHGARVKPQLPITTEVMPCQQDEVPSGSQKICASMWVWPSTKPGVTTWPSASTTSRARSRMRPIVTMRPCRTPTSARYRGRPDPSTTMPFLITRSYDIFRSSPQRACGRGAWEGLASAEAPPRLALPSSVEELASSRDAPQLALPLPEGAVGDVDGLLVDVEAERLQELRVVEEPFEVVADLREARRNALRFDGCPCVGEELVERVPGLGGHDGLLSLPWMIAGRSWAERTLVAYLAPMRVFVFDLLPYDEHLDHLKDGKELPWPLPRRHFKPAVAVRTYAEHLAAWEAMDRIGYDGVGFNEHHTSPYGLMNSPNLLAAAAAQRTQRLKLLIYGN